MKNLSFCIALSLILLSCSSKKKSLEETIPMTMANLRGMETVYNEGLWVVIPSGKKSLKWAYDHSIGSAGSAVVAVAKEISSTSKEYASKVVNNPKTSYAMAKHTVKTGTEGTKTILKGTHSLAKAEYKFAKDSFKKAYSKILKGVVHIRDRTRQDRRDMQGVYGNFFGKIGSDFKNLKKVVRKLKGKKSKKVEESWKSSFSKAADEFNKEVDHAREQPNSLLAIPHVLWGHAKALYYAIFESSGKVAMKGAKVTGKMVEKLLIAPTGAVLIAGRTVYTLGGVMYYSTKMALGVLSDTVESGLLAAMGLASVASIAPTYVAGGTVGLVNQVAFTTTGAAIAPGHLIAKTTLDTSLYAGNLLYNIGKETSKVVVGSTASALVLGYNALTQLPTQAFLGALNSAFFLAWDGPRLVVAAVSGNLGGENVQKIPVGSLIDMEKLKKSGVKYKVISDDPKVINKVLKNAPKDIRKKK